MDTLCKINKMNRKRLKKTLLWMNSSPNESFEGKSYESGQAMADSDTGEGVITFNDSHKLDDFDYIRIIWKKNTNDTFNSNCFFDWHINQQMENGSRQETAESISISINGFTRKVRIGVTTTHPLKPGGGTYTFHKYDKIVFYSEQNNNNNYIIPLLIYGINSNELEEKDPYEIYEESEDDATI